ncbi:alpha/beta hydrolase [Stutzerimonas stutzeri]|nr:alpha/beta hydrolase [Stutzerimonas stutzeri]MCQ4330835.1 alpha/beta hydrolase [Stutzerimonas stutzeri]
MGMTAELAAQLREAGNDLPAVAALYEPLLAAQDRSGVRCHVDLIYGDHARHRLDVYQPEQTPPKQGWPVVVFMHGGGFVRGNKEHRANIGWHLAQQGFVTILPNYRLAPESQWPSGPQDVVGVWHWVQEHGAAYGGNPNSVVLMGESAGAAHVAAATLRTEFQPEDWRIRGAVLLSGPYNVRLEGKSRVQFNIATPDPRNEPYFGTDKAQWDIASTVDQVSAEPFPVLISYTEQDLIQMQVQAGELFARLVSKHGYSPELLVVPAHNHFSQGYSFGTDDQSISEPVVRFILRVCEVD